MADRRREEPITEIMKIEGREKWRLLAEKGAHTYLLLEGATNEDPKPPAQEDAEGVALAAAAEGIYRDLPAGDRDGWPGGVAWALQRLADQAFFPPVGLLRGGRPGGTRDGDGRAFRALAEGRYIRVANFHATPRRNAGRLEEQLTRLARHFASASPDELVGLIDRGAWPHEKPGVVLNFFDGFRDNFDVAAPLLDRLGLRGQFFLVSGWISTPPEDQRAFADEHLIDLPYAPHELPADGRFALSPDEVASLAHRGHAVASHTRTHWAALRDPTPQSLAREAAGSRRELEEISGSKVSSLAWYAGLALGDEERADAALRDAGYDLLFANHAVQRVR